MQLGGANIASRPLIANPQTRRPLSWELSRCTPTTNSLVSRQPRNLEGKRGRNRTPWPRAEKKQRATDVTRFFCSLHPVSPRIFAFCKVAALRSGMPAHFHRIWDLDDVYPTPFGWRPLRCPLLKTPSDHQPGNRQIPFGTNHTNHVCRPFRSLRDAGSPSKPVEPTKQVSSCLPDDTGPIFVLVPSFCPSAPKCILIPMAPPSTTSPRSARMGCMANTASQSASEHSVLGRH